METTKKSVNRRRREGFWHSLGVLLYNIGFQAEYMFVRAFRLLARVPGIFILLGSVFARLFHRNIRPFFMSLGNDLLLAVPAGGQRLFQHRGRHPGGA